jgi:hypothetical protein
LFGERKDLPRPVRAKSTTSAISPFIAPRTAEIRCMTLSQPASSSSARSMASTWPRMRRTRASSFCLSRIVWVIGFNTIPG